MKASDQSEWDSYANAFSVITSPFQSQLYHDIAQKLSGSVIDFGAGSAKILPYLVENNSISDYTGIDASSTMVDIGEELIRRLKVNNAQMIHSTIEAFKQGIYDSAVSINSYYAWDKPEENLKRIFSHLSNGADFFLVNPNKALDMQLLLEGTKKEHIMNPMYDVFANKNLHFDSSMSEQFISMDNLIDQARNIGFNIISAHQQYYMGGVNFLHLRKVS